MLILALETSGSTASVAIMKDGLLLAEQSINHTRTHSETVLPMAERLMRDMSFTPTMLGALAVNIGPGSFTGIRIGASIANAMASALDIPAIGIESHYVLYENAAVYPHAVCTCIDARNEQAYASLFIDGSIADGPCAMEIGEYAKRAPDQTLFIGDGALSYREIIKEALPSAVFAPDELAMSHAASLCKIAAQKLSGGLKDSLAIPNYLRPSQAERMWLLKGGSRDGE